MARSKNRRFNGRKVRNNPIKRIQHLQGSILKGLLVCNVIDRVDGKMIARTVVYDRLHEKIVSLFPEQNHALKTVRWNWDVKVAIICRKQDGEVYITRDEGIYTQTPVLLTELNDWVAETLTDKFKQCNPNHALTMVWVAAPYDDGDVLDLRALLSPVWFYGVLGNMLTAYEREHESHKVLHFMTDKFDTFMHWFNNQNVYQRDLDRIRSVTITFKKTGKKMYAGDLQKFRARIQEVIAEFEVRATVQDFVSKPITLEINGHQQASLLRIAEDYIPKCIDCEVTSSSECYKGNVYKFSAENRK